MITSKQNQLIKNIASLSVKKYRDKQNLFVMEGIKFVGDMGPGWEIVHYVLSESFLKHPGSADYISRPNAVVVTDNIYAYLSQEETPQGIMAVARKRNWQLSSLLEKAGEHYFLVAAERLQDPGNLGTLIRTAHGLGSHGVLVSKGSADVYNPKTLRATAGSFFHLPVLADVDLPEALETLRKSGVRIIAADIVDGNYPYEVDFTESFVLLMGNEGNGLSEKVLKASDISVKIPMPGGSESLNAGIAAGILMYEAVRQRTK